MNQDNKSNKLSRRSFLGLMGAGAVAGAATLTGCGGGSGSQQYDTAGHHTGEVPTDQMTYRTNPNTGDKVSLLGYGCMRWPTITDASGKTIIDQEQVNELIDYALAHGVNYIDTAPPYVMGLSEEATGIALARHPRDSYFIATKCSNHRIVGADVSDQEAFDRTLDMYHNSFKYLQTDYIDYYLLHSIGATPGWGGTPMDLLDQRFFRNGVLDYLVKEKEAGRIRNLGFSFHGDVQVFDYMLSLHDQGRYHWDFIQIQMNYLDWNHAQASNARNVNASYLYGELEKRGIPVVIMEPLLGGRLANVPQHVVTQLKQREPEDSIASWAFRFNGTYPDVMCCLSGMTYMENLQDNIRSFAPLKPLTQDELDYLEEMAGVIASYPTVPCNQCDYCMPCPYGINIPAVFTHYNKCINEGNMPESKQDPNYRRARRAFLVGYDRSVPKLRQANHCIGCNQCSPQCPQRIQIPQEMQKINNYVESLKQETL